MPTARQTGEAYKLVEIFAIITTYDSNTIFSNTPLASCNIVLLILYKKP